jgi:hypothetical protein
MLDREARSIRVNPDDHATLGLRVSPLPQDLGVGG